MKNGVRFQTKQIKLFLNILRWIYYTVIPLEKYLRSHDVVDRDEVDTNPAWKNFNPRIKAK